MSAPFSVLKFPDKSAWVVAQKHEPESTVRVGCLITVVVTPDVPLSADLVDERCASILKTFLDAGIRTLAVEDADGPQTYSAILGPRSNALIQARNVRIVGVDRLEDISEMRAIQTEASQSSPRFQSLFRTVENALADLASQLPSSNFGDLYRLRLSRDLGATKEFEIKQLFAFERRFGRTLPADARRFLRGVELMEQVASDQLNGELDEVKRRMKERVRCGVLADDAETRFSNPDAKSSKPLRLQTGSGMVALNAIQADLLRHCRELVQGVENGMIPTSFYQMLSRQKQHREGPSGSATEQQISNAADQNQLIQLYVANTAEVLGIDLDEYPTLRRVLQQSQLLAGASRDGILAAYRQSLDKAWSHFENCLDPPDRELLATVAKTRQLQRLATLEITPEEYGELSAELPDYRLSDVLTELQRAGVEVASQTLASAKEFDAVRSRLLRFYDRARQRARQMASRTIDIAQNDGGQALLVCLGFHQPTVQATWQAERISHLIALPDVSGS